MGYADRDDDLHDYHPGIEGTGIFPAMPQAPGPGAERYAGYEWYEASSPGHYERPGGYARDPLAGQAGMGPTGRKRPSRMRPDRWVIAVGSITGAVAVYVALTTAAVPARPMPSPFAPATTQGAPARPGSTSPGACVISGP